MELTEMEKRMLYQKEGTERYAILQEMSMASRYAEDPARRKAAESLMEKLRPLTDAGGSMFAELNHYKEQAYFESHPQMYLVTPEGGFVCEVFAAFTAAPEESSSDASPWRLGFQDDGTYTTWLGKMAERSVAESDVTVTSSDRVLTLSTCAPGGAKRFVVMGKLVEVCPE